MFFNWIILKYSVIEYLFKYFIIYYSPILFTENSTLFKFKIFVSMMIWRVSVILYSKIFLKKLFFFLLWKFYSTLVFLQKLYNLCYVQWLCSKKIWSIYWFHIFKRTVFVFFDYLVFTLSWKLFDIFVKDFSNSA